VPAPPPVAKSSKKGVLNRKVKRILRRKGQERGGGGGYYEQERAVVTLQAAARGMKGRRDAARVRRRAAKKGKRYGKFNVNDVRAELEHGMPMGGGGGGGGARQIGGGYPGRQMGEGPSSPAGFGAALPGARVQRPARLAPLDHAATAGFSKLSPSSLPPLNSVRPPPRMSMPPR